MRSLHVVIGHDRVGRQCVSDFAVVVDIRVRLQRRIRRSVRRSSGAFQGRSFLRGLGQELDERGLRLHLPHRVANGRRSWSLGCRLGVGGGA